VQTVRLAHIQSQIAVATREVEQLQANIAVFQAAIDVRLFLF
jgi:hypothetical protein